MRFQHKSNKLEDVGQKEIIIYTGVSICVKSSTRLVYFLCFNHIIISFTFWIQTTAAVVPYLKICGVFN